MHLVERRFVDAARETRVTEIRFLLRLVARDAELVHVRYDDEVAARHVGRERWLMFAAQAERDLAGQAAEHLVGGINQDPILNDVTRFSGVRFHLCRLV
jgi:hypothetical protein